MSEAYDPLDSLFDEPKVDTEGGQEEPAKIEEEAPKAEEKPEEKQEAPAVADDGSVVVNGVKMVPLAALHEARRKATPAEVRKEEPEGDTSEEDPAGFALPNPRDDPEGFATFTLINNNLETSRRWAVKEHGKDVIEKVHAWVQPKIETDAEFARKILFSDDPYETALGLFNEQNKQMSTDLPYLDEDERDAVLALRASKAKSSDEIQQPREEGTGRFVAPEGQSRSRSPAAPSTTLAKASPAGGKGGSGRDAVAVGAGVAFDETFK